MDKNDVWWGIAGGCILIGGCIYGLLTIEDGFEWRGVYIPIWTDWLLLPCGILLLILSIRALRRGQRGPHYTDEEIARAKAELDAMYLREHGELPQAPPEDEDEK